MSIKLMPADGMTAALKGLRHRPAGSSATTLLQVRSHAKGGWQLSVISLQRRKMSGLGDEQTRYARLGLGRS